MIHKKSPRRLLNVQIRAEDIFQEIDGLNLLPDEMIKIALWLILSAGWEVGEDDLPTIRF